MQALLVCAIALVFGFVGSMPLAGPISVMVVSHAARREFEHALRIGVGAAVAEGIYAAVAFWGFATFLSRNAIVVPLSHAVTAVVLVVLGVRFVAFAPEKRGDGEHKTGSTLFGFSISALNPTLLATWSAIVAFLYSKGLRETSSIYAIPFGVCAGVGVGSWFVLLVKLLQRYKGKLPRGYLTAVVRFLGIVLLALGVWSGVQLVQWVVGGRRATPAGARTSQAFQVPTNTPRRQEAGRLKSARIQSLPLSRSRRCDGIRSVSWTRAARPSRYSSIARITKG